jgi:hypothetical protein
MKNGCSYIWLPEAAGSYEVRASWPGDLDTLPVESSVVTLNSQHVATSVSISSSSSSMAAGMRVDLSGLLVDWQDLDPARFSSLSAYSAMILDRLYRTNFEAVSVGSCSTRLWSMRSTRL